VRPHRRADANPDQPPVDPEIAGAEGMIDTFGFVEVVIGGVAFAGQVDDLARFFLEVAADVIAQMQILLRAEVDRLYSLLVLRQRRVGSDV